MTPEAVSSSVSAAARSLVIGRLVHGNSVEQQQQSPKMGFSWELEVSVKYALIVERPVLLTRFTKRCVYFGDALVARARCVSAVARSGTAAAVVGVKRHRLAVFADKIPNEKPPAKNTVEEDNSEEDLSEDDLSGGDCFSDVPEDSELEASQIELLDKIRGTCVFDLEYNHPDMISTAFAMASRAILGCDHGLEFEVLHGGVDGSVDDGATKKMSVISFAAWTTKQSGHMHVSTLRPNVNVPWGCRATAIPAPGAEERVAVDEKMKRVCDALGLVPVGLPSFKLLTVSYGG
jgi:hypothetical protein